jgi:PBP1b-binding outer membrane lipoprotein LpoB
MRKYISLLTLSAFLIVGCNSPTQPQQPNEIDEIDEIEMMLNDVNDNDVPFVMSGAGDDDKKGKRDKSIKKYKKKVKKQGFRKVIRRLTKYLTNYPNEEAQEYLDAAKVNMATIKEKFKNKDREGLKELVKETRQLLRKAIKAVRKARKGD